MATVTVSDKLVFEFLTEADSKVKVNAWHPLNTLDTETVVTAGDTIIGQNVLVDGDGNPITDLVAAYREQVQREMFVGEDV